MQHHEAVISDIFISISQQEQKTGYDQRPDMLHLHDLTFPNLLVDWLQPNLYKKYNYLSYLQKES